MVAEEFVLQTFPASFPFSLSDLWLFSGFVYFRIARPPRNQSNPVLQKVPRITLFPTCKYFRSTPITDRTTQITSARTTVNRAVRGVTQVYSAPPKPLFACSFGYFVRLPLHGLQSSRGLALLAQVVVGFRPPISCSPLVPYHRVKKQWEKDRE